MRYLRWAALGIWNLMAGVGVMSICLALYVQWYAYTEAHEQRPVRALPTVSPPAKRFAAWLAPKVEEAADDLKPEFIRLAHNPLERWATAWAYPRLVERIPQGTEIGVSYALTRCCSMSLGDVATLIAEHGRATGQAVHASVSSYAPPQSEPWRFP